MKKLNHLSFGLCTLFLAPRLLASADNHLSYRVKEGDTVGSVLGGLGLCPLWGPNRFTEKTIKLNSFVVKKNGNYLIPKSKILLPVESLEDHPDYEISETNEVSFTVIDPENKCTPGKTTGTQRAIAKKNENEKESELSSEENTLNQKTREESSYGILNAATDLFFSSLSIIDKTTQDTASLLSRTNQAYQLSWEQQWDTENKTFLQYRTEKHSYQGIENKISSQSVNLTGIGIGYERKLRDKLKMQFTLKGKEEIFILAKSLTNLELQKTMIPQFSLRPSYRLFSQGPFNLFGDLELKYLMSGKTSDYNIQNGYGYTFGLSLTQKVKYFDIYGRAFYGIENQDTSIIKKTTKILGIGIGLSWGFGK